MLACVCSDYVLALAHLSFLGIADQFSQATLSGIPTIIFCRVPFVCVVCILWCSDGVLLVDGIAQTADYQKAAVLAEKAEACKQGGDVRGSFGER